eukprot:1119567-Prorocentrum_minimum.AAC.1
MGIYLVRNGRRTLRTPPTGARSWGGWADKRLQQGGKRATGDTPQVARARRAKKEGEAGRAGKKRGGGRGGGKVRRTLGVENPDERLLSGWFRSVLAQTAPAIMESLQSYRRERAPSPALCMIECFPSYKMQLVPAIMTREKKVAGGRRREEEEYPALVGGWAAVQAPRWAAGVWDPAAITGGNRIGVASVEKYLNK